MSNLISGREMLRAARTLREAEALLRECSVRLGDKGYSTLSQCAVSCNYSAEMIEHVITTPVVEVVGIPRSVEVAA